jgi:hypothetical protein
MSTTEILQNPEALVTRTSVARAYALPRRAVDSVFRHCPTYHLPDYSRPLVKVGDVLEFLAEHEYRGDRVRNV